MSIRYRFFKGLDVVYYKDKSLYVNPYFNAMYQILHDHEHIPWVRFLYMVEQVLSQWKKPVADVTFSIIGLDLGQL